MARPRKNISVIDVLVNKFREASSNNTELLIGITEMYAPRPDIKELMRKYYRDFTNRAVRQLRKEDGTRAVYADKTTDSYVDIENENDIAKLLRIRKSLGRQSVGNKKAYDRITAKLAELAGQTVLQFEFDNPITITGE